MSIGRRARCRAVRGAAGALSGLALLGALLTGCSGDDDDLPVARPTTVATSPPGPTVSPPAQTTPDQALPDPAGTGTRDTSADPTPTPAHPGPGPDGVELTTPPATVEATGPAVVLVHGGFWVGGSPDQMDPWAQALAAAGSVVFNASYRLVGDGGGYPGSVDDIACAVRYARAQAPSLTTSDELVIMGHSAGGHLAAVAALNGDEFGADCPYPPAALPDRLIGLAGVYDVRPLGSIFEVFVGAPPEAEPGRWTSVNPVELGGLRDDLSALLLVGGDDLLIPRPGADAFQASLAPGAATVEVVAGAGHNDLLQPTVVGLATLQLGPAR